MTREQAKRIALKICKPFYADNGFSRWIFPVIRNMSENDVIGQLVALQPMQEPAPSKIFYLDSIYASRWERFKRWLRKRFRWKIWF